MFLCVFFVCFLRVFCAFLRVFMCFYVFFARFCVFFACFLSVFVVDLHYIMNRDIAGQVYSEANRAHDRDGQLKLFMLIRERGDKPKRGEHTAHVPRQTEWPRRGDVKHKIHYHERAVHRP